MKFKLFRILSIILSFLLLTGFVPILSFVGPGVTVLTSGNIYKAGAQFIVNQHIEKETGKNSLTLVKEELDKKKNKKEFNEELRNLVEKRIYIRQSGEVLGWRKGDTVGTENQNQD